MSKLVQLVLSLLARLPLSWLQCLGAILGRLTYSSPRYAERMRVIWRRVKSVKIIRFYKDSQTIRTNR
jgi:lauroyl/myristoyl acyltransferase